VKKALITGISGQDGRHLVKFLLELDYEIVGTVSKPTSIPKVNQYFSSPRVTIIAADLMNLLNLIEIISIHRPNEIYNLGAMSHVGRSFAEPELTAEITGLGTLRLLEAVRTSGIQEKTKIYQASSSEMFGRVSHSPQNEETPFNPISPYGIAKTFAHNTCRSYREMYGIQVSCGILFNHEGEHRGYEFVTRKITSNVARIALGIQDKFSLGNLEARRDWGYAGDYVKAMWKMLQSDIADDYVIATGQTKSVLDFLITALKAAGLKGSPQEYVTFDPQLTRPQESNLLVGDASKALTQLNWKAEKSFVQLVELMLENDLKIESNLKKK
jgi:GDPmannose 4,6-dehydratase